MEFDSGLGRIVGGWQAMAVVHMAGQQTPLGLSSMEMVAMMHEAAVLVTAGPAAGHRHPSGPKNGKRPPGKVFNRFQLNLNNPFFDLPDVF